MLIEILGGAALFTLTVFGLAWPVVARLALRPAEKLAATLALSTLAVFLLGWSIYVFALPAWLVWLAPCFAAVGVMTARQAWMELMRNPEARALLIGQAIVSGTCVGWLALIASYSGGDWVADWIGHWHRVLFFVERWPPQTLFFNFDPLPSRPPLANIITAVFAQLTHVDFARYQLFTTLHNSVAFIPAALLASRWGGARASAVLVMLMLANPLFIQNATYAWTKLSTASYVLAAIYFFLRAMEPAAPRAALLLTATCLGAGMLCHYSAGPYLVGLVVAWCAFGWTRRSDPMWWKSTVLAAAVGAAILATWFGWALATYGVRGTFLSNPSVTEQAPTAVQQMARVALNIRDTLIPHFLRDVDFTLLTQASVWGRWRDWFFQLYQRNAILAAGSVGGLLILALLAREVRRAAPAARTFWCGFVIGAFVLGIAVHAGRDAWGNTHICGQPLVLLGLAFLAARLPSVATFWMRMLAIGLLIDFTLGILLQMGAQSFVLDQWLTPGRPPSEYLHSYSRLAEFNLTGKFQLKLVFLGDLLAAQPALLLTVLIALLMLAVLRVRHAFRDFAE